MTDETPPEGMSLEGPVSDPPEPFAPRAGAIDRLHQFQANPGSEYANAHIFQGA